MHDQTAAGGVLKRGTLGQVAMTDLEDVVDVGGRRPAYGGYIPASLPIQGPVSCIRGHRDPRRLLAEDGEASDLLFMNLCNKGKQPVLEAITHWPKEFGCHFLSRGEGLTGFVQGQAAFTKNAPVPGQQGEQFLQGCSFIVMSSLLSGACCLASLTALNHLLLCIMSCSPRRCWAPQRASAPERKGPGPHGHLGHREEECADLMGDMFCFCTTSVSVAPLHLCRGRGALGEARRVETEGEELDPLKADGTLVGGTEGLRTGRPP
ncbi:hypothetical protein EYF80_029442 [Liparis tanakae]|uniref:Uncharacterized protein n=1 Tax=Liparis tanakae TaxID=230148 RepID=A0A4Z2H433_9TELE|nr:hypothetical protein EYF80_029442 [Liparis tanakae]